MSKAHLLVQENAVKHLRTAVPTMAAGAIEQASLAMGDVSQVMDKIGKILSEPRAHQQQVSFSVEDCVRQLQAELDLKRSNRSTKRIQKFMFYALQKHFMTNKHGRIDLS